MSSILQSHVPNLPRKSFMFQVHSSPCAHFFHHHGFPVFDMLCACSLFLGYALLSWVCARFACSILQSQVIFSEFNPSMIITLRTMQASLFAVSVLLFSSSSMLWTSMETPKWTFSGEERTEGKYLCSTYFIRHHTFTPSLSCSEFLDPLFVQFGVHCCSYSTNLMFFLVFLFLLLGGDSSSFLFFGWSQFSLLRVVPVFSSCLSLGGGASGTPK